MNTLLNTARLDAVEHLPATLWLSCAWCLGITSATLMPLEINSFIERLGLSEGAASAIAGFDILGVVLACLVLPRRMASKPRQMAILSVLTLAVGQLLTGCLGSTSVLMALRLLVGFSQGAMLVLVGACLAKHARAEAIWGKIILISGVLATGALTLLSQLPIELQQRGLWIGLAIMAVCTGLPAIAAAGFVPPPRLKLAVESVSRPLGSAVWMAWATLILFYGVQAGQWAIGAIQGSRSGLSIALIGSAMALSSLLGFSGSLLMLFPAVRRHRLPVIAASLTGMACAVAWFFRSNDLYGFFASQLLLNFAFNALTPIVNAFITQNDADGSLLSRTVVIAFAAVAVSTIGAGELVGRIGSDGISSVAIAMLALAMPCAAWAFGRARAKL